MFVLAALAWLPMTVHCRLESIPGLSFLACKAESSCHNESSPQKPVSGEDCCSIEKSDYKVSQYRITLPPPQLLSVQSVELADLARSLPPEVCIGVLTAAPPELLSTWKFSFRTALPARAPSVVS